MSTYLMHHGVLGQKWGVRRFQNPDGSLTKAGKKRYAKDTMKKLKSDAHQKQRVALDMGTAAIGVQGLYYELTGDKKKKEEFYEEYRKALEEGRLVVEALFKEDYSDGSVTGSIDGIPISKIKIDADGNLINEIFDEDVLYAQADFLTYIQNYEAKKSSSKESPSVRKPSWETDPPKNSYQRSVQNFMKSYEPPKNAKNTLRDIDDEDLLDLYMDDESFRKEYGVSDADYERWRKEVG